MGFLLFAVLFIFLLAGYPVALTLAGASLLFAFIGITGGFFDPTFLEALPNRIYGIMTNRVLVAVPLFIFMGITLQKSQIAEDLLDTMGLLFGSIRGGIGVAVVLVGSLMAASTGIVGATVVAMGLISLPTMLRRGYSAEVSTGTICAAGTLGQLIPPSIVLILLGDVISTAYQQAQLESGNFAPDTVSIGDLFLGALVPGLGLVTLYLIYVMSLAFFRPALMPAIDKKERDRMLQGKSLAIKLINALFAPLFLIVAVLGSILLGYATPTEAAGVGCVGALVISLLKGRLTLGKMGEIVRMSAVVSTQVFFIIIGASFFSLVFRGYGGDVAIEEFLIGLPGETTIALIAVIVLIFLLGFFLDFIEIIVIIIPTVAPVLINLGVDPLWLGVMIALNLQTSFLTPPFGFSLFYLRGVAPPSIRTEQIYAGVIPFIIMQVLMLIIICLVPDIATYLPRLVYN